MIREPKHKINDSNTDIMLLAKSRLPAQVRRNLFSIQRSGFWTKNVNGEYITLENALLCIEVDAFKDA